jgi:aminoglycoside/choline kinase family phosphotransferase
VRWPLLAYDDLALVSAADLFTQWLPKLRPAFAPDAAALAEWEALWKPIRARAEATAEVFCHRDYHAENLIWLARPRRRGARRADRFPGRGAGQPHVGPLDAAARRPPRRLARA